LLCHLSHPDALPIWQAAAPARCLAAAVPRLPSLLPLARAACAEAAGVRRFPARGEPAILASCPPTRPAMIPGNAQLTMSVLMTPDRKSTRLNSSHVK